MKPLLRCCAVGYAALLAACAGIAPQPAADPAPAFELAGRIAARFREHGFSSALRWKQGSGNDEIWLTAPLGQTIAFLQADAAGATLTTADQKQYRASSIESLTRSALGWPLPVAGMRYWVLGQTAPGTAPAELERDGANRIARFRQDGMQIVFNYAAPGAMQPSRVEIAGEDAAIRLVIDSLTLAQP